MTFVSYAQNLEDVLLWRALRHVGVGFYVDVGAAWPEQHSVTRAFYERGWHGVNVEPNPAFHALLVEERPRDRNLLLAVGETAGRLPMSVFDGTGLSTLDAGVAARHVEAGWRREVRDVEVTTLAALFEEHVPAGQAAHFLKVDVEGLEGAVLRGNDWSRHRPWVVVVEATLPLSQAESFLEWEPALLGARYAFAWADGLNRFYVAEEHAPSLLPAFRLPPNCFDDFVPAAQARAEDGLARAEARLSEAERRRAEAEERARREWTRTADAEARARDAEARAAEAERRARDAERLAAERARTLARVEGSLAWRLTRPFRSRLGR